MFTTFARRAAVTQPTLGARASRTGTKFNAVTRPYGSPLTMRPDLCRMFSGFGKPISETSIGVPIETFEGEKRVALSPEAVKRLMKDGFNVNIQKGAGVNAGFLDEYYEKEGAKIVDNAFKSDIVFKVRPPASSEFASLEKDSGLISYLQPRTNESLVDELKKKNITCYAMNEIPRLSRSQTFDALSSMANISGYKAVIEAANLFDRAFMG